MEELRPGEWQRYPPDRITPAITRPAIGTMKGHSRYMAAAINAEYSISNGSTTLALTTLALALSFFCRLPNNFISPLF